MQSLPKLIALISAVAFQASMARHATGTATEIRPQRHSNPVLTSTSQKVAGMQCTNPKPTRLPLLVTRKDHDQFKRKGMGTLALGYHGHEHALATQSEQNSLLS